MVLANSTNFIEDMSWVHHRSKPLMTTTITDTFFVHQTEAQRYPYAVGKSEKCGPVRWMLFCEPKCLHKYAVPSDHKSRAEPSHYSKASNYYQDILVLATDD